MCGISVIISQNNAKINISEIKKMNDLIIHRGPDSENYYFGENFAIGFRRLSIIELSSAGNQPMNYHQKYIIVFNGEIFNYIEIRNHLINQGYSFNTNSDTEVILASYDFWGETCVQIFNGMWSFVLFDVKKNILFCSRDRYGIKPFNYLNLGDKFLIASEIKQFTAFDDFVPRANKGVVLNFLISSLQNYNEETFFSGVKTLQHGSNLIYNLANHTFHIYKYFDQSRVLIAKKIKYSEAVIELERLFINSIKLRLRSDVNIGSCLSGGLDSSSIVCIASLFNNNHYSNTTISSCYDDVKFDEQEYIEEVLKLRKINSVKVFPDLNKLLSENLLQIINYYQDQPIAGCSHFSEYCVFKTAKENNLTVMLDGQGSDEFLAGYQPFLLFNYQLLNSFKLLRLLRELYYQYKYYFSFKETVLSNLKYLKRRILSHEIKEKNYNYLNRKELEVIQTFNSYYKLNNYKELSLLEITQTSIPYQLHSEDRNSMMHSIESRLPFLDFELTDFLYSLPDEYKLKFGLSKFIFRDSMINYLPEKILWRKTKMGFVAPDEIFIRENSFEIRKYLVEVLNILNGLISNNLIEDFDEMINSNADYNQIYFRLLSFYFWCKAFGITSIE